MRTLHTQTESFDGFSFDFPQDEPNFDQEIAALMQTRAGACDLDTQAIVNAFLLLNLPEFEQFNIYKFTNPPVIRSLHDLPSLRPWYGETDGFTCYGTVFYNNMFHAYFSKCGSKISDYLFVDKDDDIIGALENLLPETPNIIPLFNDARLQMRRLGAMLGGSKSFGNWRFNIAIPLYYLELNLYLTPEQVEALNFTPFFADRTSTGHRANKM